MDIAGLIVTASAFAGLLSAILTIDAWRDRRLQRKHLVFDQFPPIPLAHSAPLRDYELDVYFRADDGPQWIESAQVTFVRFANFGKETIRRADIPPANPPTMQVRGANVLYIEIDRVSKAGCQIEVSTPEVINGVVESRVAFEYLDKDDGALIRILTEGHPTSVSLTGDIMGMPKGIEVPPIDTEKSLRKRTLQRVLTVFVFLVPQLVLSWGFIRLVQQPYYYALWLAAPAILVFLSLVAAEMIEDVMTPGKTSRRFPEVLGGLRDKPATRHSDIFPEWASTLRPTNGDDAGR